MDPLKRAEVVEVVPGARAATADLAGQARLALFKVEYRPQRQFHPLRHPLDGWVEQLTALPGRIDAIEATFTVKMSEGLCVIGNREAIQIQTATKYLEEFGELTAAAAVLATEKGACGAYPSEGILSTLCPFTALYGPPVRENMF